MLGSSRSRKHNVFFAVMVMVLLMCSRTLALAFVVCLMLWGRVCMKIFGGITGDLLGAFVEIAESVMMMCLVIRECI